MAATLLANVSALDGRSVGCLLFTVVQRQNFLLTWNTGAQGHEDDGSDRVLDAQRAAKVRGHVADDGGNHSDAEDRNDEA